MIGKESGGLKVGRRNDSREASPSISGDEQENDFAW